MTTTADPVHVDAKPEPAPAVDARVSAVPPPELSGTSDSPDKPRPLHVRTFDDHATLLGAVAGSFALTYLLYNFVLPFDGLLGFWVGWYLIFIAMFVGITAVSNEWVVVKDKFASTIIQAGAGTTALALVSAVGFPFVKGFHALLHINIITSDQSGVGPQDPFNRGGVLHAIVGTLIEIGIAVAIALPLGVGAAIYMSEVGGKFARIVRTVTEAMTALPSVVAGLFVYTVLVVELHLFARTGFAAAMAITVMILPIIARASDVVLRVVPAGLREASLALGASRWQTVWRVVLPTVRPGLATALILGIARGIGETSPVLITSGASTFFNYNPFDQPMNSLPLYTYFAVRSGEPTFIERGFACACVLLILVLTLFVIARILSRQRVR